jgi:hypothetical protein
MCGSECCSSTVVAERVVSDVLARLVGTGRRGFLSAIDPFQLPHNFGKAELASFGKPVASQTRNGRDSVNMGLGKQNSGVNIPLHSNNIFGSRQNGRHWTGPAD